MLGAASALQRSTRAAALARPLPPLLSAASVTRAPSAGSVNTGRVGLTEYLAWVDGEAVKLAVDVADVGAWYLLHAAAAHPDLEAQLDVLPAVVQDLRVVLAQLEEQPPVLPVSFAPIRHPKGRPNAITNAPPKRQTF